MLVMAFQQLSWVASFCVSSVCVSSLFCSFDLLSSCGLQENELIIVLEWAQSGDLAQLIKQRAERRQPFSMDEIWLLFGQVKTSGADGHCAGIWDKCVFLSCHLGHC